MNKLFMRCIEQVRSEPKKYIKQRNVIDNLINRPPIDDLYQQKPVLFKDKWYSFNDAEVKPFDPNQIAAECFGGEMNSRTYDQVTDKFMDLSIEKTNSAYMLFYERIEAPDKN